MHELNVPKLQQGSRVTRALRSSIIAIVVLLVAVFSSIGAYKLMKRSLGDEAQAQGPARTEKTPLLIREGERIVIPEGSPLRGKLVIATVGEKEIKRTLLLPAVVEADPSHLVKVLPPLAGRMTQLKVQLGERVEAGQALVVLDSPDLAAAYADHERAKVLVQLALRNRDRTRSLAKIGGAATKEQQQAETDYATAEVEHQRADRRLRQIGVDPEAEDPARTVTITAPIAGSVIDLSVAPGAFWNDQTAALMTIADLRSIWVTANVPEKDTAQVAKGQPVEVVLPAYPGKVLKGQVLFVSDVLEPDTRRTKVRIPFDNPDIKLKPNMFAEVRFFMPEQKFVTVPTTALVMKNDGDRVFVEVEPWTFVSRPVEINFQEGELGIVKSGLAAGERVVVRGGVLLND